MSGSSDDYENVSLAEAYTEILGAVEDAAVSRRGFEEALEDNLGQIVSDFGLLKDINRSQLESHRRIHERLQDLEDGQVDPDELRGDRIDSDYLLDSMSHRFEDLLDEYLSDIDQPTQTEVIGSYKSPEISVGGDFRRTTQDSESGQIRYKSPEINVGPAFATQPTNSGVDASRVPNSWDDYSLGGDLSGFEFSGEPEFDSPETYLESRDTGLGEGQTEAGVSVNVSYDGASDDDLAFLNAAS
jgi:hypothetical protein